MTEQHTNGLEQRIDNLQRTAMYWRACSFVVACAMIWLIVYGDTENPDQDITADSITVGSINIVDENGHDRITSVVHRETAGLLFHDQSYKKTMTLGSGSTGPFIGLFPDGEIFLEITPEVIGWKDRQGNIVSRVNHD